MPVPQETVWPLDDHTRGKHLVLRRYLDAWLPILGSTHERVVFIDGFAGPGQYAGGEDGSPVIAIRSLSEHSARARIPAVTFLFVEERSDRSAHLESVLRAKFPSLPPDWRWTVVNGECAPTIHRLLDDLERDGSRIAPSLMMLDPFGVKGVPIGLVRRFLTHPRTEVYISFMYDSFRRFREQPEFEQHLDELFGVRAWRETIDLPDSEEARQATYEVYEQCLRNAGARFVLHFDIFQRGRLVYSVFFGTKHALGCDKMKQAMWRAAPDGSFQFRGQRGGQITLELGGPNYDLLREELCRFIAARGECTVDAVEEFLQADGTLFHSGHSYKREGLKVLEQTGKISVFRTQGARRGSFPPNTLLRRVT